MAGARDLLWRKAAVVGALWAASEIVLGSFLKNAHIPFSGRLLTGIGIAIMVAGHRLWPERGLLWRAGLICAAMKSVSPSAVLISPMIAIFTEGVLAELAVFLLGANFFGYALAGGLAMGWGLLHKAGKILLVYGPDALGVYAKGLEKLMALLGVTGSVWWPVGLAFAGYFAGGVIAALVGLAAARPGETVDCLPRDGGKFTARLSAGGAAYYSALTLPVHLALIGVLMASGYMPFWLAAALSAGYGLACALFYARAARLLGRAWLWGGMAAACVLAGWLLSDWISGVRMAARAFALSLGFAAVAQELLNPAVRGELERAVGPVFFETLEYAFGALPAVLSALPSGRDLLLRPAASLRTLMQRAPDLLAREEKIN